MGQFYRADKRQSSLARNTYFQRLKLCLFRNMDGTVSIRHKHVGRVIGWRGHCCGLVVVVVMGGGRTAGGG